MLGIVAAVDNAKGVIGVAPECGVRVVSQWFKNSAGAFFSTADAIASAVAQMKAGDVLLLETTAPPVSKFGWVPVDTDPLCFLLIKIATSIGITVVEPAGNNGVKADTPHIGGSNLDAFTDPQGKFILNRANPDDLRDSGAIMVGAASSAVPHTRMAFSNYGSRVDCYAWGENIATCGGWGLTPQAAYMINFAGTSGASAIVAGAAVLLQSWALKHQGGPLGTAALRSILSDVSLNTPSQNPTIDRIGVMPDLKRLIQHLNGSRVPRRLDAIIALLIGGIAQDGGGWKWTPGGGLTPVGPRTDKQGNGLSADQRDMIIGMTLLELASLVSDVSDRRILEKASAALILDSAGRITGKIGEQ